MTVHVDIWLRGNDFATTETHRRRRRASRGAWTDEDVRLVLEGMLQAMHRLKHPATTRAAVALRGLSWIVNPYETAAS